jgi:hypothetical protein
MTDQVQEPAAATVPKTAMTWGMLCHLAALAWFLPLGHLLGPLVVWLVKKDEHPFIDEQGKESLNFQISMTIYGSVAALTLLVIIGILLLPAVFIADVVLTIVAAIKASNGESYRYPLTIRFIK